jgi:hypothetical protein
MTVPRKLATVPPSTLKPTAQFYPACSLVNQKAGFGVGGPLFGHMRRMFALLKAVALFFSVVIGLLVLIDGTLLANLLRRRE